MKHAGTAFLVVMLLSTLGLWGIAQQKNGAYAARMRDFEARAVKLEDEQRTLAQINDKSQRRIAALEGEKADLVRAVDELKVVVAERDDLRQQLVVRTQDRDKLRQQVNQRTQERDQMSNELRQFTQDLQSLLGRMEGAVANAPRGGVVDALPASRRSE